MALRQVILTCAAAAVALVVSSVPLRAQCGLHASGAACARIGEVRFQVDFGATVPAPVQHRASLPSVAMPLATLRATDCQMVKVPDATVDYPMRAIRPGASGHSFLRVVPVPPCP